MIEVDRVLGELLISSNVIQGQYRMEDYPLKQYTLSEVPQHISEIVLRLNTEGLAVFRGGVSFVLLTREYNYRLKDIDLLGIESKVPLIINRLASADVVYINHNSSGNNVLTAFWRDAGEYYYKLDILLSSGWVTCTECEYLGIRVKTLGASSIWSNRILKISEKVRRMHSDEKTLNHYRVARALSIYLLKHKEEVLVEDLLTTRKNLCMALEVLSGLICASDLECFRNLQTMVFAAGNL